MRRLHFPRPTNQREPLFDTEFYILGQKQSPVFLSQEFLMALRGRPPKRKIGTLSVDGKSRDGLIPPRWGPFTNDVSREGEGGYPNSEAVREVVVQ